MTPDRLQPTTDAYGHSLQDWVNGHLIPSRTPQMSIDPKMAITAPDAEAAFPILRPEDVSQTPWGGVMWGSHANGGVVQQGNLTGPNPPGPDTGYASLQAGEGVITRRAMDHYGPAFLDEINHLDVPIPRHAMRHLTHEHVTTFGNGQKWTLHQGQPQRVA